MPGAALVRRPLALGGGLGARGQRVRPALLRAPRGIPLGIAKTPRIAAPAIRRSARWPTAGRSASRALAGRRAGPAEMSARSARWRAPAPPWRSCCGGQRQARAGPMARPPAVAPDRPSAAPAAGPSARHELQLCTVLANVVASEPAGFARLRGRPLATRQWLGRPTCREPSAAPSKARRGPRRATPATARRWSRDGGDGAQRHIRGLRRGPGPVPGQPDLVPAHWRRGGVRVRHGRAAPGVDRPQHLAAIPGRAKGAAGCAGQRLSREARCETVP